MKRDKNRKSFKATGTNSKTQKNPHHPIWDENPDNNDKSIFKKTEDRGKDLKKEFGYKEEDNQSETQESEKSHDDVGVSEDNDESIDSIDMNSLMNVIKKYYIFSNLYFKILSFILWIFVIIFFYAFLYQNQDAHNGFYITNAFDVSFSGDPLSMNFEDIANIEDTYIYLNNCFADGFQDTEDGKLTVGDSNVIINLVFFQNRVKTVDCDSINVVERGYPDPANGTVACIPIYSDENALKEPWGPNDEWVYREFDKFHEAHFTYEYSSNG